MNTNEAIEFKQLVQFCEIELGEHPTEYYDKYFNQIINALKCGENYEKIFITILNWTRHDGCFIPVKDLLELEKKYFPGGSD